MDAVRVPALVKRLGAAGYATLLLASTAVPAFAAELAWTSTRVRGTVIYLAGDKWEEVARGQDLTSASVRTLRSGRVSIEADGLTLELGPSSVLELGSSSQQANTRLRHYVGTITITSTGGAAEALSLQAGRLAVTSIEGEAEVTVDEGATRLSVHKGTVSVRAPGGTVASLHPGEYVASDGGVIVAPQVAAAATGKSGASTGDATPAQPVGTAGSSVSDAGGTGNGTSNGAGGNNGNANGAGNGNSGGNSNGAASSGNANAGSGNNNAGGNGNANGAASGSGPGANNAGGNGNGKANGAANGKGAVDAQTPEDVEAP